jgi:hypothetical protein
VPFALTGEETVKEEYYFITHHDFEAGARLMRAWESAGVRYRVTRASSWENAVKGAYWLRREI